MDGRTLVAIAAWNRCPIHGVHGEFCPNQTVWEPSLKCHIGPETYLYVKSERVSERTKRTGPAKPEVE